MGEGTVSSHVSNGNERTSWVELEPEMARGCCDVYREGKVIMDAHSKDADEAIIPARRD